MTHFSRLPIPTDPSFLFTDYTGKVYVRSRDVRVGPANVEHVDFGIVDGRGRKIGAIVTTYRQDRVPFAGSNSGLAPDSIGIGWFALDVHAARNGVRFGAVQSTRYFESATARDSAIERYLAAARKRAAR